MAKSKKTKKWFKGHVADPFVKKAHAAGYRSRAVYKLLEIQDKYTIINPGDCVVDLGAAPGGWCQVAQECAGPEGRVIGLDLLDMDAIPGVELLQGDFTEPVVLTSLEKMLNEQPVNVVLSDMAPNLSGIKSVDQPKSMYLAELAFDFATQHLVTGGSFVTKIFQGEGFDDYVKALRINFTMIKTYKPKASRDKSRETYLVGLNKR